MRLEPAHIEAVRISELRVWLAMCLPHIGLLRQPLSGMSVEDLGALEDACFDLLSNDAPEVETYWAKLEDSERYHIAIRGVPGAYVVDATEQDLAGPFRTVEDARAWVRRIHEGVIG